MEIRVWWFQNYRDCGYTCNPHKFENPALRFPCRVPVIPCKHLQCSYTWLSSWFMGSGLWQKSWTDVCTDWDYNVSTLKRLWPYYALSELCVVLALPTDCRALLTSLKPISTPKKKKPVPFLLTLKTLFNRMWMSSVENSNYFRYMYNMKAQTK